MNTNKIIKAKDLREKNADELQEFLNELLREHFNLRMQKGTGQETKPHLFKIVKRNIAKVKTVLSESR